MFNKKIPHIYLFGAPIHKLTMNETIQMIDEAIQKKEQMHQVVVNAAKLVNMQKDEALRKSVVEGNIINADGQSVVWASRLLKKPLPERVAGIDLMEHLVKLAADKNYKIFFLGAKEEVVLKVVDKYKSKYSPDIIAGYRNGYFAKEEEVTIAKQIAESGADILFVAMTSPKKEIFLNNYKYLIQTPFIMGVGGSFDVVSGITKRAPLWMQKNGLEWFYRVMQEPKRMWKRYLVTNTLFIGYVLREIFRGPTEDKLAKN
jgi:N-acetylglucosaminyldiphosphoundecaprenol N-acetyl-beta-D-mannosaminyltransferase